MPSPYDQRYRLEVPIWRIGLRLVERYALPWGCVRLLVFYILTKQVWFLEKISPLDARLELTDSPGGRSYRVIVEEVDEYTTRELWGNIWGNHVKDAQRELEQARGGEVSSRRTAASDLVKHMDLYALVRQKGKADQRTSALEREAERRGRLDFAFEQGGSVEKALDSLSFEQSEDDDKAPVPSRDRAFEVIKQLDELLKPV